jgi:hypothetical protein
MLTAIYYPHTTIRNRNLIKTALLLWDSIECIVPRSDFDFGRPFTSKLSNEAFDLIVRKHVPSSEERIRAHKDIADLFKDEDSRTFIENILPPLIPGNYLVYPDKFLSGTWYSLEQHGLASFDKRESDYRVPPALGYLMMSVLADACAGNQKQKITDKIQAYSLLEKTKAVHLRAPFVEGLDASQVAPELDKLISISLNVLDAKELPLNKILSMRKREIKDSTSDFRRLRLNYLHALNVYIHRVLTECKTKSDIIEVERQFKEDLREDLKNLKRELNTANLDALFSKEMVLSVMAIGGAFLHPIAGITSLAASLKGVGIIPLVKTRMDLKKKRNETFLKSNISWLYLTQEKAISIR